MRKKHEEKQRQRAAQVTAWVSKPPAAPPVKETEPKKQWGEPLKVVDGVQPTKPPEKESQGKWAEPRKLWGDPPQAPVIAQQCDATGVVIEGNFAVVVNVRVVY